MEALEIAGPALAAGGTAAFLFLPISVNGPGVTPVTYTTMYAVLIDPGNPGEGFVENMFANNPMLYAFLTTALLGAALTLYALV
jgi:hypothetical protein